MTEDTIQQEPFAAALEALKPGIAEIAALKQEALAIRVNGPEDQEGHGKAHTMLQRVVKMRTTLDKARLAAGADARSFIEKVNARAKELFTELEPVENHLREQRDVRLNEIKRLEAIAAERKEQERKAKLDSRMAQLSKFRTQYPPSGIESLSDEEFGVVVSGAERVEAERLEREEAEALERMERDAEEAEARRVEAEQLAAQREVERRQIEAQRADIAEQQRKIDAENKRLEDERQERLREEREAAQAEARRQQEEFSKAEAERNAKAEADRKAALAPVRDRLNALANIVSSTVPLGLSDELAEQVTAILKRAADEIRRLIE